MSLRPEEARDVPVLRVLVGLVGPSLTPGGWLGSAEVPAGEPWFLPSEFANELAAEGLASFTPLSEAQSLAERLVRRWERWGWVTRRRPFANQGSSWGWYVTPAGREVAEGVHGG